MIFVMTYDRFGYHYLACHLYSHCLFYVHTVESISSLTSFVDCAGVLGGLHTLLEAAEAPQAFASFVSFGKRLVLRALEIVGWDAKAQDSHTDKYVLLIIPSSYSY